jgi:aspartyl-tRNA(Asn)/glutamyl-tRNA(Gln) amidotransferase subunit A
MCGVVGLKPTYGRVSRYGLIAFGSSLDQVGPLTRTVYDAALTLGVIAGADPADATSTPEPVADYVAALSGDIRGTRVGVPRALVEQGVDHEVSGAFAQSLNVLASRGATLVDIDLPHAEYATPVLPGRHRRGRLNLARYDGVATDTARASKDLRSMHGSREHGFGAEVKRRIIRAPTCSAQPATTPTTSAPSRCAR